MKQEEFAKEISRIRLKLYRTAMLYLGNEADALEAVDETVYKALRGLKKLRDEQFFDTWITRILIHECCNELRRRKRTVPMEQLPEQAQEVVDGLPLRQAIETLPKELKDVVILRFFSGYTLAQTAHILQIPEGTVSTRQRNALKRLKLELLEEVEP